jgi:hypothetical protein
MNFGDTTLALFIEDGCGNRGLAVAQAAISRADAAMLKNLKSFAFEAAAKQARETTVVHAASRQRNLGDTRRGAGKNYGANKS